MLTNYRPQDNYWIIGGSATHVWSAPSAMASGVELVVIADADYVTWLAAGNTPGSIATAAELYEALAKQAPEVLTLVAAAQSYLEENHTERSQVVDGAGFTFRQAADEQQSGPLMRLIVPASTFPTGAFPLGIYKADDLVNPVLYVDVDGNVFNSGVYVAGSSEIVLTDAAGLILAAALGTDRTPRFARVGVGIAAGANVMVLAAADFTTTTGVGQIEAVGATDPTKRTTIGHDTTNNVGWIQASHTGVAFRSLALNPGGGNVGIGTAAPAELLHLSKAGAADNVLFYFSNGTRTWSFGINGASDFFRISDQTAGAARMAITNAGLVGIGTTAPAAKLDVVGFISWSGQKRVSAQFDKTSDTTLANITGLSVTVEAGKTYHFEAVLYTTSHTSGGVKAAIAGTATATAVIYHATLSGITVAASHATALGTAVGAETSVSATMMTIKGTITVNAGGTLTVQFAQNASHATASSVLIGSIFIVEQAP